MERNIKHPRLRTQNSRLKGQFGMMEHLLMAALLLMVIVGTIFIFFGFQAAKSKGATFKDDLNRIILSSNVLARSGILVKDDLMFDDSKLAVFTGAYDKEGCEQVKTMTGDACVTIEKILIGEDKNECDLVNFAETGKTACNSWTICKEMCFQLNTRQSKGLAFPINIFRKLENRVDLGVLTVRVPV